MIWMETFCFYCSVRLGVIVAATTTIIQNCIPLIGLIISGSTFLDRFVDFIEKDEEYSKQVVIRSLLDWLKRKPEQFVGFLYGTLVFQLVAAGFAVFGAYKLNKRLILPFIVAEFARFCFVLTSHILAMLILKKILNLGLLIAATLAGSSVVFYVGYNWAASVALYQIISHVNTKEYKSLYGDDPLAPWTEGPPHSNSANKGVRNIRVFSTPNEDDVLRAKERNRLEEGRKFGDVISVIPVRGGRDKEFSYFHLNELVGQGRRH